MKISELDIIVNLIAMAAFFSAIAAGYVCILLMYGELG